MLGGVLLGMDEVGRGSWAGPVMVGAVVLGTPIPGLRDSKQLTVKSREKLALTVQSEAVAVAIGEASPKEIDELGLTAALCLAYERALARVVIPVDHIVIDGNYNFLPRVPNVTVQIKADASEPAVSAASIIAKVTRDRLMSACAQKFPAYGFESHVGYGTQLHAEALKRHGPCELHRRSFTPVRNALEAAQ